MLHQVGVGALGPVFRTYEPTRDRLVAVKVFRLDVTPEQAQALADELSVAAEAGLFHPSIVEPIAAGVEGTVAYRAEEYVAAETLDVALRHYAPAPIDKVLPLITQLAGAIDFARTAGVGHGALHPRDIFVTPEEARATGFGVVEALERVGLRAPVRRPYSAPERVAGGTWGTAADVFSLAAIAYELLTGRRPAGTGAQIGAVTGSTAGHHPGALHAVFVQAMDEDPARRYPTALALAAALDAAARGESPVAAGAAAAAGAASLAGTVAPADVEDAVDDLPPLEDVDARTEPIQAEQEEDLFRADEPDFDDVMAEKEEDEAHVALLRQEHAAEAAGDRLLFDDQAIDDFDLDEPARAETERFADEFSLASAGLPAAATGGDDKLIGGADELHDTDTHDIRHDDDVADERPAPRYAEEPVATTAYMGGEDSGPALYDRPRRAMLPLAVTAVLALLVGFAAGYAVGNRAPAAGTAVDTTEGTIAETPAAEPAKPYSDEPVAQAQPPAQARVTPQSAGEAPPAAEPGPPTGPPPAARNTTGRVIVRSTPAGANVSMDGRWRGRTPMTIDKVPFGAHEIRVVLSGYTVATEDVRLSSGTPSRTLSFRLRRTAPAAPTRPAAPPAGQAAGSAFTGSIYVDSRPRGATVIVDGKSMGTTPVRIPELRIGSHIVRLQLADHSDWTTSTRVVSGQETRVTGSLERIR